MGYYSRSAWNAYISASGGFLFKADDNNLISFGQSTTGGDGASTKSFVLKSDNVYMSGSKVNILGERFFLGGNSQYVSGSGGNIEISSSMFHLDPANNKVAISGSITATDGTIGGFTINSGSMESSASNAKRGLKLEPGKSIRGYGNVVHSTTSVAGKFSFGLASIAPPADAPITWDGDITTAPGGGDPSL